MQWRKPPEIIPRRKHERDLYDHGTWTGDGRAMVYEVAKPSYHPRGGKRVEVKSIIEGLLP